MDTPNPIEANLLRSLIWFTYLYASPKRNDSQISTLAVYQFKTNICGSEKQITNSGTACELHCVQTPMLTKGNRKAEPWGTLASRQGGTKG